MIDAFKPKRFIFLHCCANCEYATKTNAAATARQYICSLEPRDTLLAGCHICDVSLDKTGEQISWFDEIKEEE